MYQETLRYLNRLTRRERFTRSGDPLLAAESAIRTVLTELVWRLARAYDFPMLLVGDQRVGGSVEAWAHLIERNLTYNGISALEEVMKRLCEYADIVEDTKAKLAKERGETEATPPPDDDDPFAAP